MAAKKTSKTVPEKKAELLKNAIGALNVPKEVKKILKEIKEEVEDVHAERFDAALTVVCDFLRTLERCAAEDMGGWPCCNRVGTYGPSEKYLKSEKPDVKHYCDNHVRMSFRGRGLEDSVELACAPLARWAFNTVRDATFGGLPLSEYTTAKEYFTAFQSCIKKKHDYTEVQRVDGNDDMACWDCGIIHRNPDPL